MLLNCSVGEDSWESLGLRGDQTSPSLRKSSLNIHWKDKCRSKTLDILATWCKRRGRQRMRRLDGTTDSMDMNLSRLQEIVKDREGWRAAVHGVTKSWTRLSDWTRTSQLLGWLQTSPGRFPQPKGHTFSCSLGLEGWKLAHFPHN